MVEPRIRAAISVHAWALAVVMPVVRRTVYDSIVRALIFIDIGALILVSVWMVYFASVVVLVVKMIVVFTAIFVFTVVYGAWMFF